MPYGLIILPVIVFPARSPTAAHLTAYGKKFSVCAPFFPDTFHSHVNVDYFFYSVVVSLQYFELFIQECSVEVSHVKRLERFPCSAQQTNFIFDFNFTL